MIAALSTAIASSLLVMGSILAISCCGTSSSFFGQRDQLLPRQTAVPFIHHLGQRIGNSGANPDRRGLLDAKLHRNGVGSLETQPWFEFERELMLTNETKCSVLRLYHCLWRRKDQRSFRALYGNRCDDNHRTVPSVSSLAANAKCLASVHKHLSVRAT